MRFTFKKSSRRRGFDPLIVPDQTQKFINEGNRTVGAMKDVQAATERNRANFLQGLRDSQTRETQIRQSNKEFKDEWQKAYHEAELQPLKVEIKNAKLKAEEADKRDADQKALWKLIPKAAVQVYRVNQSNLARANEIASEFVTKHHLTTAEANLMHAKRMGLEVNELELNALKTKLGTTLNESEIDKAFGQSARVLQAQRAVTLNNAAKGYLGDIETWIKAGEGGCLTGDAAKGLKFRCVGDIGNKDIEMSKEDEKLLLDAYELEWKKSKGFTKTNKETGEVISQYDDKFWRAHATPELQRARKFLIAKGHKNRNDQVIQKEHDAIDIKIKEYLVGTDGRYRGDSFAMFMRTENPLNDPDKYKQLRGQYIDSVARMAEDGQLSYEQLREIRNQDVYLDKPKSEGGKSSGKLGDLYAEEWGEINAAIGRRQAVKEENDKYKFKEIEGQITEKLAEMQAGGRPPTEEERDLVMRDIAGDSGYDYTKHPRYNYTLSALAKEESDKLAEFRLNDGSLTMKYLLTSENIHPETLKKYLPLAKNYEENKASMDAVLGGLEGNITTEFRDATFNPGNRGTEIKRMTANAKRKFRVAVIKGLKNKTYASYAEAVEKEATIITDQIKNKTDIFAISDNLIGFKLFRKTPEQFAKSVRDVAAKDKENFLSKEGKKVLNDKQLDEIEHWARSGQTHAIVSRLDTEVYKNLTSTQITNKLLVKHGRDPIEPSKWERLDSYVRPELHYLLANKPSLSKTIRATTLTAEAAGEPDPMIPIIEGIKDRLIEFKAAKAGVSSFEMVDGQPHKGNVPLTDVPIKEVKDLANVGKFCEIGPYKLLMKDIKWATDHAVITEDAPLSEENQKLIKKAVMQRECSMIQCKTATGDADCPGVGHKHIVKPNNRKMDMTQSIAQYVLGKGFEDQTSFIFGLAEAGFRTGDFTPELYDYISGGAK